MAETTGRVLQLLDATVMLAPAAESPVEPDVLMTLARACRDHEHVEADYTDRAGAATQRRLEPYQLVTTGRRWYLLAYDRDRADWRSLRLDRMSAVRAVGSTFALRPAPDAASYVSTAISASPYRYVARVRYQAPKEVLAQYFSASSASLEPENDDACVVTAGGDDPQRMVLFFAMVGAEFEILEPPEVIAAARTVSARLGRAVSS